MRLRGSENDEHSGYGFEQLAVVRSKRLKWRKARMAAGWVQEWSRDESEHALSSHRV